MNLYSIMCLQFAFGSLFVGLLVWFKRQDSIGKSYLLFSIATAIWGAGFFVMMNNAINYETALWSARVADAGALFIPVTWLHMVTLVSEKMEQEKKRIIGLYIFSFLMLMTVPTPFFVSKVKPILIFKYWLHPGLLFHLFTIVFFVTVPYGFMLLWQKIKECNSLERNQYFGFTIAALIGYLGGATTFAPNYDIPIPQYNTFLMPIYPFVMAYFLIRHKLFDLEQVAEAFRKEKLATIGLLAASINHEIRNPLYIMKGQLENALDEEGNKDPKEAATKSLIQVERVLDVIQKLNYFAKPQIQTGEDSANISEVINTVLDLISYELNLEGIKIQNQVPPDICVKVDKRQLEEILFNLIVNACHAMNEGGELKIVSYPPSYPPPTSGGGKGGGTVTLMIMDTGTGISRDHIKHIFEPFHTTKGEKGTGLGLYITKQIIERSGGKISVESKEGKGTTFKLELVKGE